MQFVDKFMQWFKNTWEGEGFSFGHIFLAIAVWNTFVAGFNVVVWPRVYNLDMLVYMTPRSQIFPIAISLLTAFACGGIGLKDVIKTCTAIGGIALATLLLWGPRSDAWLNYWGHKLS